MEHTIARPAIAPQAQLRHGWRVSDEDVKSPPEARGSVTGGLSRWAFPVTGVLAILAMTAVFFIALRDQILGIERFCYRHGREDSEGPVDPRAGMECRDDLQACELSKQSMCREHRAHWVSQCGRADEVHNAWQKTACSAP
jgi:hypothetical protein